MPEVKSLVFNRPFALLLCNTQTNAILFAGVVYEPGPVASRNGIAQKPSCQRQD
jgi:hypothetical protein